MGGRNKSKKFLKQKQGNQKKRSKFQVKSPEGIAKSEGKIKSKSEIIVHSAVESVTNNFENENIGFENEYFVKTCDFNENDSDISSIIDEIDSIPITKEIKEKTSNVNEIFDECLENLNEKDAIMRQTTLLRINRLLRENTDCNEYLKANSYNKLQTLSMCLRDSIQHGEEKEQCISLETVSLLFVTLKENHSILENIVSIQINKLIETSQFINVKIEALKTWTCMIWTLKDESKTSKTIDMLENIFLKQSLLPMLNDNDNDETIEESKESKESILNESELTEIEFKIIAIECWSWLIASIENPVAIGSLLEEYNDDFLNILQNNNNSNNKNNINAIELKCVLGEALTLLFSNYKISEKAQEFNNKNKINFDKMDNIFYELYEESDIKRKNLLKEQKTRFRLYLNTIENNWNPKVKIKLRGLDFEKQGWNIYIIYQRIKNILKHGFQLHLLKNPMVQSVFDMKDISVPDKLTKFEKKSKLMAHADNAKQQKQHIKGQRSQKQAFMFNYN